MCQFRLIILASGRFQLVSNPNVSGFKCILPCLVTSVELCVSQGSVAANLRIAGKYCTIKFFI